MNKNMAGILSAAAVLTMLAGCTAYVPKTSLYSLW